jgi:phosphoglycolate phosphatase-like HAD superfamily hydrolase
MRRTLCLALVAISTSATRSLSTSRGVVLVTFDVDGTLVHGSSAAAQVSAHARAFGHAVGKIFGNLDDWEKKVPSPPRVIPPERYHGSTDGIIALNLAWFGFSIAPDVSRPQLDAVFREMFGYVARLSDEEVAKGISPLPGVEQQLRALSKEVKSGRVKVGLVTGNVEGIARKKMRACQLYKTGVFSPATPDQQSWPGEENYSLLGGFGSDYCSGDIEDLSRIWKDRGEQILIALRRAQSHLPPGEHISRVIHVGDAPADVLAAHYCSQDNRTQGVPVRAIAACTGKFTSAELHKIISDAGPASSAWETVVLEQGVGSADFLSHIIEKGGL